MSELNKFGVKAEVWSRLNTAQKSLYYRAYARTQRSADRDRDSLASANSKTPNQRYMDRVKSDPERYQAYLAKKKESRQSYRRKLRNNPQRYACYLLKCRAERRRHRQRNKIVLDRPEQFGVTAQAWAKLTASERTSFYRKYVLTTAALPQADGTCEVNKYGVRQDVWVILPEKQKRFYYNRYSRERIKKDPLRREKLRKQNRDWQRERTEKSRTDPKLRAKLLALWNRKRQPSTEESRRRSRERVKAHYWRDPEASRAKEREKYSRKRELNLERERLRSRRAYSQRKARLSPTLVCGLVEQSVPRTLPPFAREEVVSRIHVAILEGKLLLENVGREVRAYIAAHYREYDTYKTLSLDAPIAGTNGATYLDLLKDRDRDEL